MRLRLLIGAAAVVLCACGSSAARTSSTGSGAGTTSATTTTTTSNAGAGGSGGTGGSAGASVVCGPSSALTLASDRSARLYARAGEVYGCARGGTHPLPLGTRSSCMRSGMATPLALRGDLAAYGLETCGVDFGGAELVVRRLTDGRRLLDRAASTTPIGPEGFVRVTALVIARDGSVAWIVSAHSILAHRSLIEVVVFDNRGVRRLDRSQNIAPARLQLQGSRVRWKHGASWRSAAI